MVTTAGNRRTLAMPSTAVVEGISSSQSSPSLVDRDRDRLAEAGDPGVERGTPPQVLPSGFCGGNGIGIVRISVTTSCRELVPRITTMTRFLFPFRACDPDFALSDVAFLSAPHPSPTAAALAAAASAAASAAADHVAGGGGGGLAGAGGISTAGTALEFERGPFELFVPFLPFLPSSSSSASSSDQSPSS